ncbi:hypothetical protein [Bacillus sp. JJ1474]|uniref:hypothetical protein n=1 Tax=Bacillus sp. JJ1474 TaxID=3122955 RepID=UPI00300065B5
MQYLADLSQIVFAPEVEEKAVNTIDFKDSMSESILSIVEMIILPHLELKKLKETGEG